MEKITVRISGRKYTILRVRLFPGTPREVTVNVAEYRLNAIIEKRIAQRRYHEVMEVDSMYSYYLPREVDPDDERGVRESIEDVYEPYIAKTTE